MNSVAHSLILMLRSCFRTRARMQIEILALRHQTCCVTAAKEACKAQSSRPFALGDPFPFLEAMELDAGHRQTGNSDCLAPAGLQVLLALEE